MRRFTLKEYRDTIQALQLAIHQLEPDGYNCIVCGDNDHQAWECDQNPMVIIDRYNRYMDKD